MPYKSTPTKIIHTSIKIFMNKSFSLLGKVQIKIFFVIFKKDCLASQSCLEHAF